MINKLYLELSQFTTATTAREKKLVQAAKNVVAARHNPSDRGWDILKEAIGELENEVEKFK